MSKVLTIQRYLDNIYSLEEAADILGCSNRTVQRYVRMYKQSGPPGLIHKLTGKLSNNQNNKWDNLHKYAMQERFKGFGPTLLSEKLEELLGYSVPVESLRRRMIKRGLRVPKVSKKGVKRSPRKRKSGYGLMIQFDGSYHDRLENGETKCLLLAVDDATGSIVHAEFTQSERLIDIIGFFKSYFEKYGKPSCIYLDCHSTYKVNHGEDQFDQEMKTRFQVAMGYLGVQVIYSRCPQGKGRVENKFKLFQDRGIKEMKLANISTYDEANIFLHEYLIPTFNEKFAVDAEIEGDFHIKYSNKDKENLERYFAKRSDRKINKVGIVQYRGAKYLVLAGQRLNGTKKVKVLESHEGNMQIRSGDNELEFEKYG